jgi:hypothetical protein
VRLAVLLSIGSPQEHGGPESMLTNPRQGIG